MSDPLPRELFLFIESRSVPLDLFYKGRPDTPNEPKLIRSRGQNPLRRIHSARKKCSYRPITEPTIFKAQIPARFDLPSPQGDRRCLCGIHDPLRYLPCFKHHVPLSAWHGKTSVPRPPPSAVAAIVQRHPTAYKVPAICSNILISHAADFSTARRPATFSFRNVLLSSLSACL